MAEGVFQGEDRAPGMAEQRWRLERIVLPHLVEVIDVGRDRHVLRPNAFRGSPAPPLIVVDELEPVLQLIQVGQEIAVVEIGPAVEDDNGLPMPDGSAVERGAPDPDASLERTCALAGLLRSRQL
jgi:hypothetical protein